MAGYHLAQINIGRIKGPLDGPAMVGFMARLDEINALADSSPGFVWRLQTTEGNATYLRPYPEDDRILLNMSVWETGPRSRRARHPCRESRLKAGCSQDWLPHKAA